MTLCPADSLNAKVRVSPERISKPSLASAISITVPFIFMVCRVVVVAQGTTVAQGSVAELLSQTGETDFENAFVKLAFEPAASRGAA